MEAERSVRVLVTGFGVSLSPNVKNVFFFWKWD